MSQIIFVKPVDGKTVMHPDQPHLVIPEAGQRVSRSTYWVRMEKQGAVTIQTEEEYLSSQDAPPPVVSDVEEQPKPIEVSDGDQL